MCPNTISPSMCCPTVSGTCSTSQARTTIIDIHTATTSHQDDNNKDTTTNTFLHSLSSHLDILTAGSLFLLPSILPFLASALTADSYSSSSSSSSFFTPGSSAPLNNNGAVDYVSPSPPPLFAPVQVPSVPGTTPATALEPASAWTWTTTWIMLLPCLGVVLPLALFKIMTLLEERHVIQCPYTRWSQHRRAVVAARKRGGVWRSMRQNNTSYDAADGQTFKAIKRVWRNLLRIESDDCFGYAPLPSAYQDEVSAEEGLCVSEKEGMHLPKVDFTKKSHQHRQVSSPSALPRPKTILLASLWAWTMLMTFSAKMGFNSLEQISVPPSSVSSPSSPPMPDVVPYFNVIEQGGGDAPIFILPSDLQPLQVEEQDGQIDLRMWEPTSNIWSAEQQQQEEAIVSLLGMDIDVQFDAIEALWAQGQQPVIHSEEDGEVHPFARIQTSIVLINNNDAASPIEPAFENMIEDDVEDLSSLDAMIMDPQDEAVFHDFLHQLDQEDAAAALDVSQKEPQDQERLDKLIKATDDLMVASMLDNDLPCSYYHPSTPTWFSGIRQFLVGGSLPTAGSDIGGHFPGRTFIYTGWSTDLMILAIAICLGGVLVGLAQSKILYHQLLDQHMDFSGTTTQHRRASWTTLLTSLVLSGSGLGLTFLMIADESWDVPAIYFVGIGIAGIILVHAWVPNAALTVYNGDDSNIDEDSSDEDDDTCIGSDTEMDVNNKFSDETPLVWSPPFTERRNACSLDENHRWEVVATATFHEAAGYTR